MHVTLHGEWIQMGVNTRKPWGCDAAMLLYKQESFGGCMSVTSVLVDPPSGYDGGASVEG